MKSGSQAVNEIGKPTNLATFTVILAFLPMLWVTGHDGAVHGADPVQRAGGHARFARHCLHRGAVGGVPLAQRTRI